MLKRLILIALALVLALEIGFLTWFQSPAFDGLRAIIAEEVLRGR